MTIDTTRPRSRRALLLGALGGVAAAAVATVARVSPVGAADGDPVLVGQEYHENARTGFQKDTHGDAALMGSHASNGIGVFGTSLSGSAIEGFSGSGYALRASGGRIKIEDVSGVATIKKGRKSVTVSPGVDINAKTFVLLTPRANIGSRALWYTTKPIPNKFVIRMSSTRGLPTKVAWLALERG